MTDFFTGTQEQFDSAENKLDGVYLVGQQLKTISSGIVKNIGETESIDVTKLDFVNILNGIKQNEGGSGDNEAWEGWARQAVYRSVQDVSASGSFTMIWGIEYFPEWNKHIAVTGSSNYPLLQSVNGGSSWSSLTNPAGTLYEIKWIPELNKGFACGSGSVMYYSTNGTTWTSQGGLNGTIYSITWSPELELGIVTTSGSSSYGNINSTTNMTNFTNHVTKTTAELRASCWSAELGLFVACGNSGTIITSPNGTDWTIQESGTTNSLQVICWSAELGLFVACGNSGTIITSSNGTDWTIQESGVEVTLYGVCYSKFLKTLIATGTSGTFLTSTSGADWVQQPINTTKSLYKIYSNDDSCRLIVGSGSNNMVASLGNLSPFPN